MTFLSAAQGGGKARNTCPRIFPRSKRRLLAPKRLICVEKTNILRRFEWCCERGLNSRPLPYQGSALPLSYAP